MNDIDIELVAAFNRTGTIGKDGQIPWHIPEDLKRFKKITQGSPVVMGRLTAESIGRALPGRLNLVLTSQGEAPFKGQVPVASLEQAVEVAQAHYQDRKDDKAVQPKLFVIGGERVYYEALPYCTGAYFTLVDDVTEGNAHFPLQAFMDSELGQDAMILLPEHLDTEQVKETCRSIYAQLTKENRNAVSFLSSLPESDELDSKLIAYVHYGTACPF